MHNKSQKGFTLIELLVVAVIALIIVSAVATGCDRRTYTIELYNRQGQLVDTYTGAYGLSYEEDSVEFYDAEGNEVEWNEDRVKITREQ